MKLTKDKVFHGAQKPFPTLILQDYVLWLRYFKLDNPPTPRAREPKLLVWPLKGIFFSNWSSASMLSMKSSAVQYERGPKIRLFGTW